MPNSTDELRLLRQEKLLRIYRNNPAIYAEQVLEVEWTEKQAEIVRALKRYRRVMVKASHSVGKTHVAGGVVNWFFDCHKPSITLTTAPTKGQVVDLLWKEVRVQRQGRPGLLPKAPRMETGPDHYAEGLTARTSDSFQGRHEILVLIVFDEATGIDYPFWDAAEGMLTGDDCYWLVILNPTDVSSRAYQEEQTGAWHVITLSALEHPNIAAELAGQPAPYPAAVRLGWIQERIRRWCKPVGPEDKRLVQDFEFPPGSGSWYRPGPEFEGRVLGRWPSTGIDSVWSEALWDAVCQWQPDDSGPLQIGCDVARFGDDFTSICVRRGRTVLWHETHNGWSTTETTGRLKLLASEFADGSDVLEVPIVIDDDGVGGGVVDPLRDDGYRAIPVSAGSQAVEPEKYPNRRSELWFVTAGLAEEGLVDLSRLDATSQSLLKRQAMAPKWKLDGAGRRVVEPKQDMKKRLKRSPDDMDALNLAFCGVGEVDSGPTVTPESAAPGIDSYQPAGTEVDDYDPTRIRV